MSSIVNTAISPVSGSVGVLGNLGGLMNGITNPSNGVNWQAQGVNYGQNAAEIAQQQQTLNQAEGNLQQIASGQGPNPAKSMLAGATGENIKAGAGLIASTKGINPALAAQLASQQATNANMQSANQMATLQANQQIAANQALIGAATGQQQAAGNIIGAGNQAQAHVAGQVAGAQANILGNLSGGAGTAMGLAHGGQVRMAQGGMAAPQAAVNPTGPQSFAGKFMASQQMMSTGGMAYANGGKVPAKVSPGELYLNPHQVEQFKHTGHIDAQRIPGHAKVKGDSLKNDTVNKTLQAGGIVVPRTKAGDPEKAAKFVAAVLAKSGRGLPKKVK